MKKGILIAFTGIDGSGKTTQAKLLIKDMRQKGVEVTYVWCRWEPFLVKPFIRIWKRKAGIDLRGEIETLYGQLQEKKSSMLEKPFLRTLWLCAFFIDYGMQVFFRLRMRLLRRGVVISDRFFYDSLIDQAINLGQRGEGLLKVIDKRWVMSVIFPSPDLVIYIDCPEEIAHIRKPDTSIDYLHDRRKLYSRLVERYDWIRLDGTYSVNDISQQIKEIVYKKLGL